MSVEEGLYSLLSNDEAASALVGSRIFPLIAPQADSLPYITYQEISGIRQHVLAGPVGMVCSRFQINCWGQVYEDCDAVATAVRKLLDGYAGTAGGTVVHKAKLDSEIDLQELVEGASQSERRGKALDFIIWFREEI